MKFCIQAIIVSLGFAAVAAAAAATATPPTTYTTSYSESKLRSPSSQQQRRKLGIINAVDTSETYYAEDAQAWRYLGTYIDCSENDTCQRYLLWAAYVDKEYTGDKDGSQYMFYNEVTEKWDNSYCDLLNGDDSRCVPMDCHLPVSFFVWFFVFFVFFESILFHTVLLDFSEICFFVLDALI